MNYGYLSFEKENLIISIMSNNEKIELIDGKLLFTIPGAECATVKITSLPKPLKIGNYEDKNESTIMKKCVMLEIRGEILPIFKGGDIFINTIPNGSDIPRKTHLKSDVAATFFTYAVTVYGRLGGDI